ncbi:hypothetical protein GGR56DRAFT_648907 [Xylariaceae sp. FL0804]|nr:hypothetical protein GGR56DRAFT_648907 [Xylariaceae sp. FL0804]
MADAMTFYAGRRAPRAGLSVQAVGKCTRPFLAYCLLSLLRDCCLSLWQNPRFTRRGQPIPKWASGDSGHWSPRSSSSSRIRCGREAWMEALKSRSRAGSSRCSPYTGERGPLRSWTRCRLLSEELRIPKPRSVIILYCALPSAGPLRSQDDQYL